MVTPALRLPSERMATAYAFERHCVVGNAVLEWSWTWQGGDINHPDVQNFMDSFYPH
jgi:hypothetical protein